MKISVITCTWNSANHLNESISSVLAQNHPDIEYIFVDGGSTDGTLEMIQKVPREVKLIQNVSGGISRAMNAGIEAATGEVIAHLHSDDYYAHPHVLSSVADALDKSMAGWLFGRCYSDIGGVRETEGYTVPRYSYRRLLKGNFIPHPATFVRRHLFERIGGFDESIKFAMDYDMWLRLGSVADPIQINEYLSVFRRHSGSLSTANKMASLMDDFKVRMRHAPKNPWSFAYHGAHYLARRRRLARALITAARHT